MYYIVSLPIEVYKFIFIVIFFLFFFCFLQVLSTLHEYPCLESCPPLIHYVSACVRLAWKMVNQKVPYYLDNDFNLGKLP